jgi:hypothetical protein
MVGDLTTYLYGANLLRYIEGYVQKVSPQKTPDVVGALLDAEAPDDFVNGLILSVRCVCVDPGGRGGLGVGRAGPGSQDAACSTWHYASAAVPSHARPAALRPPPQTAPGRCCRWTGWWRRWRSATA